MHTFEIRRYHTRESRCPFEEWLDSLRDSKAQIAIERRINRLESGNFGDCKFCRDGVWELRIEMGPGYRVYYARSGQIVVLLLCGGDKSTQDRDIASACRYWLDWRRRANEEKADERPIE
jgi:putative addiction module killer protein